MQGGGQQRPREPERTGDFQKLNHVERPIVLAKLAHRADGLGILEMIQARLAADEPRTRPQHARELRHRAREIRHVVQHVQSDGAVETPLGKRQPLGDADGHAHAALDARRVERHPAARLLPALAWSGSTATTS